jgi:tetratricopeptide (TPR) repeat protein
MKYRVNHLLSTSMLLSLLLGVHVLTTGQSTQCECATPPGGSVTCEKGQVPICIVKDGKVKSICKSPPESRKTVAQQNAWILSMILEKEVTEEDLKRTPEYQGFLRQGRVITADANVGFLSFNPPAESLPHKPLRRSEYVGPGVVARPVPRVDRPLGDAARRVITDEDLWKMGTVYLDLGENAKAVDQFQRALKINPRRADNYHGLGRAFYLLGKLKDAEAAYRAGLQINPNSAELNADLGVLYYEQNRFAEAEEVLKRAVSLDPSTADFTESLGTTFYAQLKFAEAEAAIRSAVRLKPDSGVLQTKLGDALYAQQKYAEAQGAFRRGVLLEPHSAILLLKLGDALYAQQKYAEAKAAYAEAEKLGEPVKPDPR